MFINRISNRITTPVFKGYEHEINEVGKRVLRFNFPYDFKESTATIEIYKVRETNDPDNRYDIEKDTPIASVPLNGDGGTEIDLDDLTKLDSDAPFAYRFKIDGNYYTDSGISKDGFNIVTRRGSKPNTQGPAILTMPKMHRPGAYYLPNGLIKYSRERQKDAEGSVNNFSATADGSLAGIHYDIPYLKSMGIKYIFLNPVPGCDTLTHHGYSDENNYQLAPSMGTAENYNAVMRDLYKSDMVQVYDATLASEGLQGNAIQYALRWAEFTPQTFYHFRMDGLKNAPIGLGVVPKHKENLRHKVINAPVVIDPKTNKIIENISYDSTKDTLFQIYDGSLVTPDQENALDRTIDNYRKLKTGEALKINSHDDTVLSYVFTVDPKEYERRLEVFLEYNKDEEKPMIVNSPEGTMLIAQFSNFALTEKVDGGLGTWDANTDLAKKNFNISGYDEKQLQAIVDPAEREYELLKRKQGAMEVQDMAIQTCTYWTQKAKDVQILYTAQKLQGISSNDDILKLVNDGLLPKSGLLTKEQYDNVVGDWYNLSEKGIMPKDDLTIKSLMKLPFETLEFAKKTVAVLSTSYFSNRATIKELRGVNRFDLMQQDNPHLLKEYADTYLKANHWFKYELKTFADDIINEINKTSEEKLLDEEGNYTEYGEYIIELMGPIITKYAMLKSLAGDNLKPRLLADNQISYNYDEIKPLTDLGALGIKASSPKEEAKMLSKLISKGLEKLDESDIKFMADSISKQIKGTTLESFQLAEAMVDKAGLGLAIRLDAMKDVMDWDAVRNKEMTVDKAWDQTIDFWAHVVKAVKAINPSIYIVAEITDLEYLLKDILGEDINAYNSDNPRLGLKYKNVQEMMQAFFDQTGVTSEAGYSYTFTDLLKTFSAEFEKGDMLLPNKDGDPRPANFIWKIHQLIREHGLDYIRNMFTFADNHDKPSVLHGMALDMGLFFSDFDIFENGNLNVGKNRRVREETMKILTNSDKYEDMPLEAQLNIDNVDYFKTTSSRAVAMSKLFRDIINEDLKGIASDSEIALLKQAMQNLTNGNYLGEGTNVNMASIQIDELKSLENALNSIMKDSNIKLKDEDIKAIINSAKDTERMKKYTVYGDFNWTGQGENAGKINQERARRFLPDEWDYMDYSPYTVAVAALLEEAFKTTLGESEAYENFIKGGKNFIKTFNRKYVESQREPLPFVEDSAISMKKNGYAARDFETVVRMIIEEANYIAEQTGKASIKDIDALLAKLFSSAIEPAVEKAVMYSAYLSALPGIPTVYLRNILGALGFDEKAKNQYLQNRNYIPWSQLEEGPLKEIRNKILERFKGAINIRNREGVRALNSGTPYITSAYVYKDGKATNIDSVIPTLLMQDSYGNMTLSIFNSVGIDPHNRVAYDKDLYSQEGNYPDTINKDNKYVPVQSKYEIDFISLGAGLALPIGLEFVNSDPRDTAIYITKRIGDLIGFANKSGGRISLNGITNKNGVTVLKHVRHLPFKGRQYHFASNPYQSIEKPTEGEKLSIIAK